MRYLVALALLCTCTPPHASSNLPPDPPTFQKVAPITGGSKLTWKNPTDDDFDGTLVARFSDAAHLDGKPMGKALPEPGQSFGSGQVLYVGTGTEFTDTKLPDSCGTFTYQLWSHDRAGHFSGGGVVAKTLPGGLSPPTVPPTSLTATHVADAVQLHWAKGLDATTTRIVRRLGGPPVSPDDGTKVFEGTATDAIDPAAGLPLGQDVYYGAFSCNSCGACADEPALKSVLIPNGDAGVPDAGSEDPDGGSPLQPSFLTATLSADAQRVELQWTNPPASTGFTQVKVLRQLGAPPTGPADTTATIIFTGLGTSASERVDRLLPDVPSTDGGAHTYYYAAYGCANATCEQHGERAAFALTLVQALRGGGYTIWWRHATAALCADSFQGSCSCTGGTCTNCPANNWWKSCDRNPGTCTARQLGDVNGDLTTPNTETSTIHSQFAAKNITVGRVMSSEYCRAIQTAQGFNFGPPVEQVQDLTYYVYDEGNRCTDTYTLLNQPPTAGTNTAMVSHAGFLSTCPVLAFLNWSEGAIFKPVPGGSAQFIAQVKWDEWANLR